MTADKTAAEKAYDRAASGDKGGGGSLVRLAWLHHQEVAPDCPGDQRRIIAALMDARRRANVREEVRRMEGSTSDNANGSEPVRPAIPRHVADKVQRYVRAAHGMSLPDFWRKLAAACPDSERKPLDAYEVWLAMRPDVEVDKDFEWWGSLQVCYENHRGETANRRLLPLRMWFGRTGWHPKDQWFLEAVDLDKNAVRSFAVNDIQGSVGAWWASCWPLPDALAQVLVDYHEESLAEDWPTQEARERLQLATDAFLAEDILERLGGGGE